MICGPWDSDVDERTPRLPSDPRKCPNGPGIPDLPPPFPPPPNATIGPRLSMVEPGLRSQYTDDFVAGVELEVIRDVVVGVAYQHRRMGDVIEDVSTDGASTYVIANPGRFDAAEEAKLEREIAAAAGEPLRREELVARLEMFRRIRRFDRPRRDYHAVQLTARRRISAHLFAMASYTWSRLDGNYPGLYSPDNGQLDPNITSQYDLVELLANRDGPLPGDLRHNFKLDGLYMFELGAAGAITTALRLRAASGRPIDVLGAHDVYGPDESFILPRGAGGRTDFVTGLDLALHWERALGKKARLTLSLEIFNVLNQQPEVAADETYTTSFVNPIVGGGPEDLPFLKESGTGNIAQPELNFANTSQRAAPLSARLGARVDF
jgi:hypothetical protein